MMIYRHSITIVIIAVIGWLHQVQSFLNAPSISNPLQSKMLRRCSNTLTSPLYGSKLDTYGPVSEADVLVVGSGISGSTAAYYLQKNGAKVLLSEAKDEVGGNLISKKGKCFINSSGVTYCRIALLMMSTVHCADDGYLWEEGPNSFQPNRAILRLAKDLNMLDELVLADPTLPRYVFWEGELHALPSGPRDLLNFNLLSCNCTVNPIFSTDQPTQSTDLPYTS